MKYSIRYYLGGDKTRFFDTEIEFEGQHPLGKIILEWENRMQGATIQKIVKL